MTEWRLYIVILVPLRHFSFIISENKNLLRYYKMAILYNGDCLEEMKQIDDNSIDLIFTDLPYAQTANEWDHKIDLNAMWTQFLRIKKLNTPIFFTTTTKYGIDIINSAPKQCPFRYDLIWEKSSPVGHLNCKVLPMRSHEMIYVFYEKKPYYDLSSHQYIQVKKEGKGRYGKTYGAAVGTGNTTVDKAPVGKYDPPLPRSIIKIQSKKGNHSTEKPVDLMKWIFKYYSKEGDVVLDNCMGSGSTGVAANEMNRNFIGIEMNEDIFNTAFNRINPEE